MSLAFIWLTFVLIIGGLIFDKNGVSLSRYVPLTYLPILVPSILGWEIKLVGVLSPAIYIAADESFFKKLAYEDGIGTIFYTEKRFVATFSLVLEIDGGCEGFVIDGVA